MGAHYAPFHSSPLLNPSYYGEVRWRRWEGVTNGVFHSSSIWTQGKVIPLHVPSGLRRLVPDFSFKFPT